MRTRSRVLALTLTVGLMLTIGQTATLAGASLFSDDFEADPIGSVPAGWTAAGGTWSVQVDGSKVARQSTATGGFDLAAGSATWTDYTVSADVKEPGTLSNSFGLEGRRQNATNGYLLTLSEQRWKLVKNVNGFWTVMASGAFAFSAGTFYRLGLGFSGSTISATVNGQTMGSVTDKRFAAGAIGLRASGVTEFDNVSVVSPAAAPGPPVAAIAVTPSAGVAPLNVTADASASTTPSGTTITAFQFDFGDGTTVGPQTSPAASHVYAAAGSFTVSVTVTNSAGLSASTRAPVVVSQPPPTAILSVSPSSGAAPLTVTADASASTAPSGTTITGFTFDFGDGTVVGPQGAATATHLYVLTGSFTVTVTVTSSAGLSAIAGATLLVSPPPSPPIAALTVSPASGVAPLAVIADASASSTPAGTVLTGFQFEFGDGSPAVGPQTGATASHQYAAAGSFLVTVTVINSAGLSASASATVTVGTPPPPSPPTAILTVSPSTGTAPLTVTADAGGSTTPAGTSITGFQFEFGDGSPAVGPQAGATAAHQYVAAGSFTVTLTVTNSAGLRATATATVSVVAPPPSPPTAVLSVSPISGTAPLTVTADASGSTTPAGTSIIGFRFEFGDGAIAGPQAAGTATHRYTAPGSFTVTVTVSNSAGQSATASASVSVSLPPPAAVLHLNPVGGAVPLLVTADAGASSTPSGTTISSFRFDFGDGSIVGPQAGAVATHQYTAVGSFSVSVTVTNSGGQSSTAAGSVLVAGLTRSQQVRPGVINGPPNNQVEMDTTWADPATGNGWQVGVVPGYGGANVSFWSEVDGNQVGPTQAALNTTTATGLFHDFTHRGTTYTGSEDAPFSSQELAPIGTSFRRGFLAVTPISGSDANGFRHRVTTYVYPGDPGFLVQRFDLTNPSTAAISLSSTDSIELSNIGGLQQADTTWQPGNGRFGFAGGSTGSWPASLSSGDPDYYFITPAASSAVKLGVVGARRTSLASLGVQHLDFQFMQNSHRLKVKIQGDLASFPGSTTVSFYLLQALRRNLTAADAASMAADYLNPDTPAMASGQFTGFSYDEGAYVFRSATGTAVLFTPGASGPVSVRWLQVYKVTGWTGTGPIAVTLGGSPLRPGVDYLALVDAGVAYVKLMKPMTANPGPGQLPLAPIVISG